MNVGDTITVATAHGAHTAVVTYVTSRTATVRFVDGTITTLALPIISHTTPINNKALFYGRNDIHRRN